MGLFGGWVLLAGPLLAPLVPPLWSPIARLGYHLGVFWLSGVSGRGPSVTLPSFFSFSEPGLTPGGWPSSWPVWAPPFRSGIGLSAGPGFGLPYWRDLALSLPTRYDRPGSVRGVGTSLPTPRAGCCSFRGGALARGWGGVGLWLWGGAGERGARRGCLGGSPSKIPLLDTPPLTPDPSGPPSPTKSTKNPQQPKNYQIPTSANQNKTP